MHLYSLHLNATNCPFPRAVQLPTDLHPLHLSSSAICFPDLSLLPEPPAPGNAAAVSPCIVPMYCPRWWLLTLAPHGSALPAPPALTQQAAFRKLSETYLQDF